MNFARLSTSPRLQALHELLRRNPAGCTTRDIAVATGDCAAHSTIAELRANGVPVLREYLGCTDAGRRVHRYRLGTVQP